MLFGETSLFIVRTIRNTQIHHVGKMQFRCIKAGSSYSKRWTFKELNAYTPTNFHGLLGLCDK
jgi:hypothetical protein